MRLANAICWTAAAVMLLGCEGAVGPGPSSSAPGGTSPAAPAQAVLAAPELSRALANPRCTGAGPKVEPLEDEYVVTLRAANGKYVSADCGGDDRGLLLADADTAGEWETFYLQVQPDMAVALRTTHGWYVSAVNEGGDAVDANRKAIGTWETFRSDGALTEGTQVAFRANDGQHWLTARIDESPVRMRATAPAPAEWERFTLHVVKSPVKARTGVVRGDGRNFVDDGGPFYPLGGTLFWAVWGWKNDRERVKANLDFLAHHKFDYVRILGEVDWPTKPIDPNWSDYQQVLGELIDFAYDQCGLRTELTLVGGKGDPMAIAQKVAAVVNAGRQHKILNLEIANESYQRPLTLQQMRAAGQYLLQNTQNLVALSSAEGLGAYVPNTTDWKADTVTTYMQPGTANLLTIHMDRTYGDDGWRTSRQPWDWKDLPFPISHNEPIGPRSSVAEETDAMHLTMIRAVGLINGVGAFVLHNGAGVFGAVDPARNRPANLWEVPGINDIMRMLRGLDRWVPKRAGDGTHWNNAWAGNPWVVDAFWGDGANHGVNRNYTVATPTGWISTEAGVKDYAVFTAGRNSRVEVFDLVKGRVKDVTLNAGQTLTLTPETKDGRGYGAFIVVGHDN